MNERRAKQRLKERKAERERHKKRMKMAVGIAVVFCAGCIGLGALFISKNLNRKPESKETVKKNIEIKEKEKPPVEVTISMVGDVMLHTQVQKSGRKEDGSYNYDHLFTQVREKFQNTDINIANQEIILGGTELGLSTYPSFNGAFEVGDALANAGVNVVLHATNHTLDKGTQGTDNCMNFWKEKHPEVAVLGMNASQEEQDNIYIYEKEGFKIAILNYTYGTNGIPMPKDRPYLVNLLDEEKIDADLKKANELADFIIVCPHWGNEYQLEPSEEQKKWCEFFLKRGVDLVMGAHPHVIQPVEWVEDAENKMLVYYSLGNFTSRQADAPCMVGGMANVTIEKDGKGNTSIKEYSVDPLVTHIGTTTDYTTYFLKDYTQELAAKNKIRSTDGSFTLDYCKNLSSQVFGELYQ